MTPEEQETIAEKQFPKKDHNRHKKPRFRRQESWRYKRVGDTWRRPHGIDSKMRKKVKGWPPSPCPGYRSLIALRNVTNQSPSQRPRNWSQEGSVPSS